MLTVHHLNNSRSQRILWLLEELEIKYDIRFHQRDPHTHKAPPELKSIHPMGKSPVIVDKDNVIAETGAIIVYILDIYGQGKFRPALNTPDYINYVHFLHFAEGSAMFPFLLNLYTSFLGDAAEPLNPLIMTEIKGVLDYCEYHLIGHDYFAGDAISGADIQMIFPLEAARARGRLKGYDACNEYVDKIWARPAYRRALKKGGDYAYGPKK